MAVLSCSKMASMLVMFSRFMRCYSVLVASDCAELLFGLVTEGGWGIGTLQSGTSVLVIEKSRRLVQR